MRGAYEIRIPLEAAVLAFRNTLCLPLKARSDFFIDLRSEFRKQVKVHILAAGIPIRNDLREPPRLTKSAKIKPLSPIKKMTGWKNEILVETDAKFSVGYGADDYSLQALNYLERSACELPSLRPFLEIRDFTLGNFAFDAPNEDCDISVVCGDGIELTGLAIEASRRKRFSYFALLGVRIDPELLRERLKYVEKCDHPTDQLDEIRIGTLHYPVTYICRHCGHLLTCKCFAGTFDVRNDLLRHLPYGNSDQPLALAVEETLPREGICSLCTGRVPRHIYGHSMYYSTFLQRYLPYQTLFARRRFGRDVYEGEPEYKELENETRQAFGYMQIGQKWLNETFLFKIVSMLVAPAEVIHHYRGKELEGLEIDVWIPSLGIGIEYQGEQHFRAMEHWGGQTGLERRLSNDKRKKALCQTLGYELIEFNHAEAISEDTVRKRLTKYLNDKSRSPRRDA
jgi:hypothetical protein